MTTSARIARLKWALDMDRRFRAVGWRTGEFLFSYYRGRLAARLGPEDRAPFVTKTLRHPVSGSSMRLRLQLRPWGGHWLVLRGVWLHQDYWHPVVRSSRRTLDIGANIGAAAIWFAGLNADVEIACVEPDPRNVELLRENLELNRIEAAVFQAAVSDTSGEGTLGISADTGWSALEDPSRNARSGSQQSITVRTMSVTEILDSLRWPTVDLVKIDIEGGEYRLLASGADWLPRVGAVLMELHGIGGPLSASRTLAAFGWRMAPVSAVAERTYFAAPAESDVWTKTRNLAAA